MEGNTVAQFGKLDIDTLVLESERYDNPLTPKQRAILEAAEALFAASGFAETSTASIAKAAGVTEKTLFKHFPTKRDLLRRILFPLLLKVIVPMQVQMMKKLMANNFGSFKDFYRTLALNRWQEARAIGPRMRILLAQMLQDNVLKAQVTELFRQHAQPLLLQQVERFQKSGELRLDISSQEITKHLFFFIGSQALLRGVIAPEGIYDDISDVEVSFRIFFHGVETSKNN